jgi:hypothetical protein
MMGLSLSDVKKDIQISAIFVLDGIIDSEMPDIASF